MNTAIEQTYIERAAQMNAAERAELKRVLSQKFAVILVAAETYQTSAVTGINAARELGAQIELFTGQEKLIPAQFSALAVAIPDATMDFAKACLALHRKFPEPVDCYERAAPEWERLLVQLELLPTPERGQAQSKPLHEPLKDFIAVVIKNAQAGLALVKEIPLEEWDQFFLEAFIRESQPFMDLREKAVKRLARK